MGQNKIEKNVSDKKRERRWESRVTKK